MDPPEERSATPQPRVAAPRGDGSGGAPRTHAHPRLCPTLCGTTQHRQQHRVPLQTANSLFLPSSVSWGGSGGSLGRATPKVGRLTPPCLALSLGDRTNIAEQSQKRQISNKVSGTFVGPPLRIARNLQGHCDFLVTLVEIWLFFHVWRLPIGGPHRTLNDSRRAGGGV